MSGGLDVSRIQAICFDLDGTLVETDDAFVARIARLLRPLQSLFPALDGLKFARRTVMWVETPINSLLAFFDQIQLDQILSPLLRGLHRLRGEKDLPAIQLVPGVREALEQIRVRYPMAIVTTRNQHSAEAILERYSLGPLFRCLAYSNTCRRTKPHPAPLLWVSRQLGVDPAACLMVGDTTVDMRAASAAGFQSVGVLCGFGERQELETAGAGLVLESTSLLAQVLLPREPAAS